MDKIKIITFMSLFLLYTTGCTERNEIEELMIDNEESVPQSEEITLAQIVDCSNSIFNNISGNKLSRSEKEETAIVSEIITTEGSKAFLIKKNNSGGFVLLSSNKDFEPILAYDENGTFSDDYIQNESFMFWLNQTLSLSAVTNIPDSVKIQNNIKWKALLGSNKILSKKRVSRANNCDIDYEAAEQQAIQEWIAKGWQYCKMNDYKEALPDGMAEDIAAVNALDYDEIAGCYISDYAYIVTWTEKSEYATGPIVSTKWGQDDPYNIALKRKYSKANLLGCSAVALGQIVKYHRWVAGYDYAKMPDRLYYDNGVLPEFLMEMGELIGIDYANASTPGASISQVIAACKKIGYNPQHSIFSYNVSASELPMFVYGSSATGGKDSSHIWVCDGCSDQYYKVHYYLMIPNPHPEDAMVYGLPYIPFNGKYNGYQNEFTRHYAHFNWGWSGVYDGWYIDAANPGNYNYLNLNKITVK